MLVGVLALAGCGGRGDRTERSRDTGGMMGQMDSGGRGMEGMDSGGMGMGGMNMQGMEGMQMMPQMRAHMDSMMRMSPQRMQSMMATHQGMMSQMMDRMGGDMRNMKMSGTPEWAALTDSVKQDLAELPNLKGQALSARVRTHADRVKRLLAMHEKMVRK